MRASQVTLNQEVTRNDAMVIMNWMKNKEITKYLNESVHVILEIQQSIERVNTFIMTHLFNREGSFFLIYTGHSEPVGFLKLVRNQVETEIVIVIGDEKNWGKGIGKASIKKGLDIAFFQWRASRVIAKINSYNSRSIKAFEKMGFLFENKQSNMMIFSLSMENFISKLV